MLAHVINDVALSQAGEIATRAYRERPLDATPCCSLFLLRCVTLMTTSHSQACVLDRFLGRRPPR